MEWVNLLSQEVYERLCNCRTIKADLPELVFCRWITMAYPHTKEDALVRVLELLDENGADFDLTHDEWDNLIK